MVRLASRTACSPSAHHFATEIPRVLELFHQRYWPVHDQIVTFNSLVAPNALRWENGRLAFYNEAEGVYSWAVAEGADNPAVIGAFSHEPDAWTHEEERLCRFLLQMCLFEAVMGAQFGASVSWCAPDETRQLLTCWSVAPIGAWRWPSHPTRFYVRPGALAVVTPNYDGFTFKCGATDPRALDFLRGSIGSDWQDVRIPDA